MNTSLSLKKAQPRLVALFASDIHLNASIPKTTQLFLAFLKNHAAQAEQLYLLGDLFEYWAGDDAIGEPYNQSIIKALRDVSDNGVSIFWIAGNRDFLTGTAFAKAIGATILEDESLIEVEGKKIIIAHGDAQCTDDTDYMAFRKNVRQPSWQQTFLSLPLTQRKSIIDGLRTNSQIEQKQKSADIMDVNKEAIANLFYSLNAQIMIHGHTHRPDKHRSHGTTRYVLPDWDCDATPVRGGWLAIYDDGTIQRRDVNGLTVTDRDV